MLGGNGGVSAQSLFRTRPRPDDGAGVIRLHLSLILETWKEHLLRTLENEQYQTNAGHGRNQFISYILSGINRYLITNN